MSQTTEEVTPTSVSKTLKLITKEPINDVGFPIRLYFRSDDRKTIIERYVTHEVASALTLGESYDIKTILS